VEEFVPVFQMSTHLVNIRVFQRQMTSRGTQLTSLGQVYKILRLLEITRDSFKVEWKLADVWITKEDELSLYSKFFGGTSICPRLLGC